MNEEKKICCFPLKGHDRVFEIAEIKGKLYVQQNADINLITISAVEKK